LGGELPGPAIGLENHLNYIHRPGSSLDEDEAVGLASLLGTALFDRYFRVSNRHTQVNATELRALPLPPLRDLATIGGEIRRHGVTPDEAERVIAEILRVPRDLIQ
jgi:adenine-specific DNA-methyltransferase